MYEMQSLPLRNSLFSGKQITTKEWLQLWGFFCLLACFVGLCVCGKEGQLYES